MDLSSAFGINEQALQVRSQRLEVLSLPLLHRARRLLWFAGSLRFLYFLTWCCFGFNRSEFLGRTKTYQPRERHLLGPLFTKSTLLLDIPKPNPPLFWRMEIQIHQKFIQVFFLGFYVSPRRTPCLCPQFPNALAFFCHQQA